MTRYEVELAVGDWSTAFVQTEHAGESVLASGDDPDDAYALAGAELSWELDGEAFPSQPTPTQLKLQLYVPDIATGPEPAQGQVVAFTLTTEGYRRNRYPNSNLRVNDGLPGWSGTRMTLTRVQQTDGRWNVTGTVSDASVTTSGSQRINTATAPCKPGDKCWAAAMLQPSSASGLTHATGRIIFVDDTGAELSVGNGATGASYTISSAAWTLVDVPATVAPAGAAGFRIRYFLPSSESGFVGVGDVLRVKDLFLTVADDLVWADAFNVDNLQPVATFDGRVSDVDAQVFKDGLVYELACVDYVSELNEVTIGDTPWPEEFVQRFEPVGFPDSWESGRYVRIAELIREASRSQLNVIENPNQGSWDSEDAALLSGDPIRDGETGTYGGLSTSRPRDVDAQQASDLLAELCRQVVMVVNPDYKTWENLRGEFVPIDYEALPYYLTPIMGQGVAEDGTVSVFPVWVTDRIRDNGYALEAQLGVDGVLRLADKHVSTIAPGVAMHVPASVVDRDDITWRMDKSVSPNVYQETYTGEPIPPSLNAGFLYDIFQVADATPSGYWSWLVTYYWVAHGPLVAKNGAVQVLVETDSTQDYYQTFRWVPILGRYYDAQALYMIDQLTLYPATLEGQDWPRLFAHRNPYGYWSGHVGRWVFVHGIDDRWNPHPNGLYYGQLTGAQLQIQDGGKVVMACQLRHRMPGAVGDTGALNTTDLPAGLTSEDLDPAIRFVDLSVTSRTVEEL